MCVQTGLSVCACVLLCDCGVCRSQNLHVRAHTHRIYSALIDTPIRFTFGSVLSQYWAWHLLCSVVGPLHRKPAALFALGAAAEMPDFSIPATEAEYTGDPDNKTNQVSHRKHLMQLELQAQAKKVCACTHPASLLTASS